MLGLAWSVTIGVASAAPAYGLAALMGVLAALPGLHAPAGLLLALIPMVCTAAAYHAFDRVSPDAGSVFAWLWRAVGPRSGWIAGWALIVANVIVMASLGRSRAVRIPVRRLAGGDSIAGRGHDHGHRVDRLADRDLLSAIRSPRALSVCCSPSSYWGWPSSASSRSRGCCSATPAHTASVPQLAWFSEWGSAAVTRSLASGNLSTVARTYCSRGVCASAATGKLDVDLSPDDPPAQ